MLSFLVEEMVSDGLSSECRNGVQQSGLSDSQSGRVALPLRRMISCCMIFPSQVCGLRPFQKSRFQGHGDEAEGFPPVDFEKAIKLRIFLTQNGCQAGDNGAVADYLMAKRRPRSLLRPVFSFAAVDPESVEVDADGVCHKKCLSSPDWLDIEKPPSGEPTEAR
jgi:hypothetical protein